MADKYYSVALGEGIPALVTEGSSSSSKAIEVRINDSVYAERNLVVLDLMAIVMYLQASETSPIA